MHIGGTAAILLAEYSPSVVVSVVVLEDALSGMPPDATVLFLFCMEDCGSETSRRPCVEPTCSTDKIFRRASQDTPYSA